MNTTQVYLIGAGPGDPGLMTLRGREVLGCVDVVVYDYLANGALLDLARPGAELVYVGKKGGEHTLPQAEINALLVDLAKAGKRVARLKGGDPFVFGRGGEEALALAGAGIAFEVVPGVTAGVAVAAYAGIPVTQRGLSSSVAFITGHEDADKTLSAHDWAALAHGAETLVFYMGVKNLPEICRQLLAAGMPAGRPAAIVQWGATPRQRSLLSTVAALPQAVAEAGITAPALIIVGEVAALRESLQWYERRPLFGRTIVVTRSRDQAGALTAQLTALGAQVLEFPCIEVLPLPDQSLVHGAIGRLADYQWVVFTSANGVKFFWEQLTALGKDARALAFCQVAAIGPGTAAELAARGITADFVPQSFVAESVAAGLVALGVAGERILIPRAVSARDVLPQELERAGAVVRVLPVYEARPCFAAQAELEEALARGEVDCVTFASSSTVDNFFARIPVSRLQNNRGGSEAVESDNAGAAGPDSTGAAGPDNAGAAGQDGTDTAGHDGTAATGRARKTLRFACIGPITRSTLEAHGLACDIAPQEYTIAGLAAALAEFYSNQGQAL